MLSRKPLVIGGTLISSEKGGVGMKSILHFTPTFLDILEEESVSIFSVGNYDISSKSSKVADFHLFQRITKSDDL